MDARTPGADDDLTALPIDVLRELVFAQGADETDERWIRAAAELTRRERAADAAGGTEGDHAAAGGPADPPDSADPDPDPDPPHPSRRPLAWAAGALVVGLLAGAGIAASVGGSAAPSADPTGTPSAEPTASAQEPPDPARVRSLLGTDITGRSRAMGISGILDRPQEQADRPPRSPYGDVDLSSIRGVQTSVGLYAARTISDDVCLLVYPWAGSVPDEGSSPGSGVMSCVSPDQLAASGLQATWVANVPTRAFDGSVTMAGSVLTAAVDGDGMVTLTSRDRPIAY
ncbi:hypothetical protein [Clavibacter michiganensis]|uniref:Uncharacterized protein n=1 Tax=Clavibacter michiganensis TaxID=28447 RepID=A0A251YVI9_9MICO|nr:hypothetical protein [Clavibacter michiganensis]OUE28240.1 hypothetical protein BFL37_00070 [Clavibacter michiganensis]